MRDNARLAWGRSREDLHALLIHFRWEHFVALFLFDAIELFPVLVKHVEHVVKLGSSNLWPTDHLRPVGTATTMVEGGDWITIVHVL